ncbi:hypothetical protein BDW22DRAFT_473006 [Trametopsis cervina]|nr:hypothetical protein BDW22DRAFT_473006 [Trametopsis cervina]
MFLTLSYAYNTRASSNIPNSRWFVEAFSADQSTAMSPRGAPTVVGNCGYFMYIALYEMVCAVPTIMQTHQGRDEKRDNFLQTRLYTLWYQFEYQSLRTFRGVSSASIELHNMWNDTVVETCKVRIRPSKLFGLIGDKIRKSLEEAGKAIAGMSCLGSNLRREYKQ